MRCRRSKDLTETSTHPKMRGLAFFGSYGVDSNGHAIKTEDGESFAKEQEAVACSLTQRLSIIKGELWYQINVGLPLFDKSASSTTFDAWILQTIQQHPDVVTISSFSSYIENHVYHCSAKIVSKYGDVEISI